MDIYVFLVKYTQAGVKYGDAEHAKSRWQQIEASLQRTLGGRLISHYVCLGPYDGVVTLEVPPGRDFQLFQCLRGIRAVGDIELTVLRAFDFRVFTGETPARG
jgi:uncharacterized protein with GYD domain